MKALKLAACDCENVQDFVQYYKGGLLGVSPKLVGISEGENKEELIPVCVTGIKNTIIFGHYYKKQDGGPVPLPYIHWDELKKFGKFGKPMLGVINNFDTYVYLWDFAKRESLKGLRFNGVQLWAPDFCGSYRLIIKKFGNAHPKMTPLLYWNIFNPEYIEWYKGKEMLENGDRIGIPISNKVGLYTAINNPNILVSYKYKTVGRLGSKDRIILDKEFKYFGEILKYHVPISVDVR